MRDFTCPRSCHRHGETWCRFRPITDMLGHVRANSHTAKISVEYRDMDVLRCALEKIGADWLGQGKYQLYTGRPEEGIGFKLRGWIYPCVLSEDGQLHFDNYSGEWGNTLELDRLGAAYAMELSARRAVELGWQHERTPDGLLIYHPEGGTLLVTAGAGGVTVDANGFIGDGCHAARESLGIGSPTQIDSKREAMLSLATIS